MRSVSLKLGFGLIGATALCALALWSWPGQSAQPSATARTPGYLGAAGSPAADPLIPAAPAPETAGRFGRTSLGRGGTLDSALQRLEVPRPLRLPLVRAASEHVNLRQLSARTGVVAEFDRQERLLRLALRAAEGHFVRIRVGWPAAETPEAALAPEISTERIELPVQTRIATAGGVIERSLAQALAASHHGAELTAAFAEVFQWDIDLNVDPRPGDEIRIVYEVRQLGEVPEDLPAFGRAASDRGAFLGIGRLLAANYSGANVSSESYWVEPPDAGGGYFDSEGRPLRKSFLKSPLPYRRISSGFSRARLNPVTRRVVPHHGVDFAARAGTPVVATADGRVSAVGWQGALGRAVRIRHGSGYVTVYGHLQGYARGLEQGSEVKQGERIGYVGSSGRATGAHLHYTVIEGGRPIDPMKMKAPPAEPLPVEQWPFLEAAQSRWSAKLRAIRPGEASAAGGSLALREPEADRQETRTGS